MNKTIICTTGTSIANGCPSQGQMFKERSGWNGEYSSIEKELNQRLNSINCNERKALRSLCAELNSLDHFGIDKSDRVILLVSDTALGRVCAEAIEKVLIKAYDFSDYQVVLRRVEGLQVHSAKTLRESGLKELVKITLEYLQDEQLRYSTDIIINPTGGFKGVVPFMTILGMLYGKQIIYIFEHANEVITLPPMPFSFDLELYQRVRHALTYIDQNIAVSTQAYLSKIVNYTTSERDLFLAFTEPFEDNLITLSPLAYCLLSIESEQESVMISESALEALENVEGKSTIVINRLLKNTANPLWRTRHIKTWPTTDLLIIKQTRTAERVAGFIKGDLFYVTHIFQNHNDYERILSNYTIKDFDHSEFEQWQTQEHCGVEENNPDAVLEERDQLLYDLSNLKEQMQQMEINTSADQLKYETMELTISDQKQVLMQREQENESFSKRVDQLEGHIVLHEKRYETEIETLKEKVLTLQNEPKGISGLLRKVLKKHD